MPGESRTKKALLNARVSMICYFVGLVTTFFTRKIFIDYLGTEFIGLTGTLQSLLGFLNIAELGVGTAIAYVLYEPLHQYNQDKIKEILSVLRFLYRCIGTFILVGGLVLSAFLPMIFENTGISMKVIFFGFYAYLTSSLIGYYVNYNATLLSADQKNYVVTGYYQIASSAKAIIQMVCAIYFTSFYLFLAIEFLFSGVNAIILQWKINKTYPWLSLKKLSGRKLLKNYPKIKTSIAQLTIHKIAGFVQFQIMPFFVYAYVSLPMVTLYTNYTLISQRVMVFISGISNGLIAGIGDLIAEGNTEKIEKLYHELLTSRIIVCGAISLILYFMLSPLVSVWLESEYLVSEIVVSLIAIASFLSMVRSITDFFINGFGLFYDVWAPFAEIGIYVSVALLLGPKFGLNGLLLAPIVSLIIIVYGWKPYFLFKKGFKRPFLHYLRIFFPPFLPLLMAWLLTPWIVTPIISFAMMSSSWLWLILGGILVTTVICAISFGTSLLFWPCMRSFFSRFLKR